MTEQSVPTWRTTVRDAEGKRTIHAMAGQIVAPGCPLRPANVRAAEETLPARDQKKRDSHVMIFHRGPISEI